ncbi:hypothetical protein [Blastopirellula marina]|uniref:Uncharacterized protein n=1 Tax=Blastopirellula marina DSM 3645 TaxID=314230 RepID=A3ZUX6_9BACT|nr:hypothetical protein [Blastopirellula marina]EAQ79712.1 hypothetical protein DSM3645_24425 [Blastopirellula marina DSM 3645]
MLTQAKTTPPPLDIRTFFNRLNRAVGGQMTVRITADAEDLENDEIAVVCWDNMKHFAGIQVHFNREGGVWLPVGGDGMIAELEKRIGQLQVLLDAMHDVDSQPQAPGDVYLVMAGDKCIRCSLDHDSAVNMALGYNSLERINRPIARVVLFDTLTRTMTELTEGGDA